MRRLGFVVVPLTVLFLPSAAFAHKMELEATMPADRGVVRVVVGFEGDEPAEGVKVRLVDAAGGVVAEGTSDANGVCEFARPAGGEYTIVANDGDGHQAKERLSVPVEPPAETVVVGHRTTLRERILYGAAGLGIIAVLGVVWRVVLRKSSAAAAGGG
jgi:hypothetical protein